jgi:sec-independent protein translocase protein TatB
MLNLDPAKLLVIAVVAIILLGPDKLPQVARQVGGAWRSFNEFRHRMETEVRNTMPDLPSTTEIARLARSPSALLDHLSNMGPDETTSSDDDGDGDADGASGSDGAVSQNGSGTLGQTVPSVDVSDGTTTSSAPTPAPAPAPPSSPAATPPSEPAPGVSSPEVRSTPPGPAPNTRSPEVIVPADPGLN